MTLAARQAKLLSRGLGVLTILLAGSSMAATVTVDPSAAQVPGSVYDTLENAIELNAVAGDAWANGNDDTVLLVTSSPHIVVDKVEVVVFGGSASGTMTVRSVGPGPALIVADAFGPRSIKGVFEVDTSGTFKFEGLTIIGGAGKDGQPLPVGYEYRSAFRIECDNAGEEITVEIRDCVVTANDGINNPIVDYSQPFPVNNEGTFMRGLFASDDRFRGKQINCTVENCVFAYLIGKSGDKGGGTHFFRRIEPGNPDEATANQEFVFRNCLFANCLTDGVSVGGATRSFSVTMEDCLITRVGKRGIFLELDPGLEDGPPLHWGGPTIDLRHCIIDSVSSCITNSPSGIGAGVQPFTGSLALDEATLQRSAPFDAIYLAEQASASGTYQLRDVISFGAASLFRLAPDPTANSGPNPYSLAASNLATDNAVLPTQAASVQSTLSAAVVLSTNPQYEETQSSSVIAGLRAWNSQQNNLFDVGSSSYIGQGFGGRNLRGGADLAASTPVGNWALY